MKKIKFAEAQILAILKEQELCTRVAEICQKHGISEGPFYNWGSKNSDMT